MGVHCSTEDIITVYDYRYLNLTYNESTRKFENNFFIDNITNFNLKDLTYNFTRISAKIDWYPVENQTDGTYSFIDDTTIAIAQKFEVKWDYALFKGAKLIIDQDGLNIGTNNLDLIIVKANSLTGQPNMSEVCAYDLNSPYNSSNTLPIGNDTFRYFAFNDAILQRGDYFLVANLSNPSFSLPTSSAKHFRWYFNQLGTDDGGHFLSF
ncbi:MAG: hypothetical protein ACTSX6_11655 [Candidatus Heimdallarchaeaceae archaeon]